MLNQKAEMLPFHALNQFMRPDFRMSVVRAAFAASPGLPEKYRRLLDNVVKKHVKIHGFRNAEKAPTAAKAGPAAVAFEKHPEVVAAVLSAWAESQPLLRQQVFDLLKERGWVLLPLEAHREKLPGFFIRWPKEESFEILNATFKEAHVGTPASTDEISLMIVWVASRLPYALEEGTAAEVTKLGDFDQEKLNQPEPENPEE